MRIDSGVINFQKLHYFCVMVEEGGIHKAARRLGLSQPPLSVALRELESDLGCQLVFRSGHNWVVTDAGQRLYEEGRSILAQTSSLEANIRHAGQQIGGEVKCAFSTSCISMFREVLPVVAAKYSGLTCQAIFTDSGHLAGNVRRRQIDFAVLYLPVDNHEFEITPLRPQRLVALFSNLLPAPAPGEMPLEEICSYPLLIPQRRDGRGIYSIFAQAVQKLDITPRILCRSQSTYILRDMLRHIPAVAILPECEASDSTPVHMESRAVRELANPITPAIITLKKTFLPQAAVRIISILQEYFA